MLYLPDKGHCVLKLRNSQLRSKTVNRSRLLVSPRRARRDKLILGLI
jgi:hypothetical protein